MDGYQVMTAGEAAPWGELFITATGNVNVFRREHFEADARWCRHGEQRTFRRGTGPRRPSRDLAEGHVSEVRDNVQEFDIGGKRLHLVAEGRLVNLSAAEGHPAAVMDMSFANQALSAEYVVGPPRGAGAPRLRRPRADRRRGCAAEAGRPRDHPRRDDGRAEGIRLVLAARHLRQRIGSDAARCILDR